MPEDKSQKSKKVQDNKVNQDLSVQPATNVVDPIPAKSGTNAPLQDMQKGAAVQPSPPALKIDEQASLDELAEKLAKWKLTMSKESSSGVNQSSKVVTSPNLKQTDSPDETGGVSVPVQKTIDKKGESVKQKELESVPLSQDVRPVEKKVKPVPAGISVTSERVEPDVESQDVVKQFEKEVQEAVVVKSVSYPKDIKELLKLAQERGASDLHLTVGYPPIFRIDGKLVHIGTELITTEMAEKLIFPVLAESKKDLLEVNREVDVAYEIDSLARFRVNVYHERGRLAAAFRLIPERIKTIEELNLPKILRRFTKLSQGFVLVTGPTGHGKTTTLASLLQEINKAYEKHIITIEDPIEYVYPRAKALVSQREMHEDTHSWEIALRSAMREDPDVVLVGEMRDHETISSAITLAETGHLVFATLHTNSSSQTIDRIIDSFPDNQQRQVRSQLASIIEGVVCQRLIPVRTGGRRPACEIMLSTSAVKNLIREGKIFQIDNVIRTSLDVGMTSMENSLVQLVREGLISVEQAEEYATDPEEVIRLLR